MQTSPEALSTTLRLVDFISISRMNGDCVVLLLAHPGPNMLGRYLPLSRINALLLAEPPQPRLSTSQVDAFMGEIGEGSSLRDVESTDTMDLATFLECAFLSAIFFISDTTTDLPSKRPTVWRISTGELSTFDLRLDGQLT